MGGAAKLPLKQSFKVGPHKTHISKTRTKLGVLLTHFDCSQTYCADHKSISLC